MDWGIIGTVAGLIAILGVAYTLGKYAGKLDDLIGMRDRLSDGLVKTDSLWQMKDNIAAAIIKIDTLWKIYIEDSLSSSSDPGGNIMLPDEIKGEIRNLLDNDKWLCQTKEPTLLIIDRIGVDKLSQVARDNKVRLGVILAQVNSYVFDCLTRS